MTPESVSLRPGAHLGRYQLLCAIAKGGMATVWAARLNGHRGFKKLVALKTTHPQLAIDADFERMFLDEARLLSSVQHPNVCQLFELCEEEGRLYMAMEWIHGDSLGNLLRASGKAERIDPRLAARIGADVCGGLHAAHELTNEYGKRLGVVHRDVTPHNILVTLDGHVKVADFGIAKAKDQIHDRTVTGEVKGKIGYMAPEQLRGNVDRRSDVFSLGCVLYELTTGKKAFDGDNDAVVLFKLMASERQPPSQLVEGYPEELEHIVLRAMAPDPDARFESALAMRTALETWIATTGAPVMDSAVASIVKERLGAEIESRRVRIRDAAEGIAAAPVETPDGEAVTRKGIGVVRAYEVEVEIPSAPPPEPEPEPVAEAKELPPMRPRAITETVSVVVGKTQNPVAVAAVAPVRARTRVRKQPRSSLSWALPACVVAALILGGVLYVRGSEGGPVASPSDEAPTVRDTTVAQAVEAPATREPDHATLDLELSPTSAIVALDGTRLPPGTRSVEKPREDQRKRLVVRAAGYVEQVVMLDENTQAPVVVHLGRAAGHTMAGRAALPAIPANPYAHSK